MKRPLMKRLLIVAGIVVGLFILALVLVPLLINVDNYRPDVETKLSAALGRTVHVGKLEASLLSGGAKASDISISDDPAFGQDPFLKAGSVKIGLELLPLIFSKQIRVTSISVENPEIVLLRNAAGKWNYSTLGTAAARAQSAPAGAAPDFSVGRFEIVNGKITMGQSTGHAARRERVYQKVHLLASNISATSSMPFTVSAETPGGGSLELEGQAGPLDQQDSAKSPMQAKVTLEHADVGSTGFFDPNSGLAGVLDFDGKITSDGHKMHSDGKGKANNMKLVKGGAPARQSVSLDYISDFQLDTDTGTLEAHLHVGGSTANVTGTLNTKGETTTARLKIQTQGMAVNDAEGLLPAFGVTLPSGSSLQGGTINADLTADGPLDRLVITGPVTVSGTRLTGYDLTSKLGAMGSLTGIKGSRDTLIQTFRSNLRVAQEGIRADSIFLDVPSIGQITGNGVVNSNSSLDFKLSLKAASGIGSTLGVIASMGQGKGIPFAIDGTTANPQFRPEMGSMLKNGIPGADQAGGVLGGLFGKKKPK
jgi:AsmA protein